MPANPEVLRAWRRSRGWDKPEMARRLRKAAGSNPVPLHDALVRMIHYWESGKRGITERYELLYAVALEIEPDHLCLGPGREDGAGESGWGTAGIGAGGLRDGPGGSDQDADLLRHLRRGAAVDAEVITIFRAETQNLRLLDRRLGAPTVIGKTRAHVEQLVGQPYFVT